MMGLIALFGVSCILLGLVLWLKDKQKFERNGSLWCGPGGRK